MREKDANRKGNKRKGRGDNDEGEGGGYAVIEDGARARSSSFLGKGGKRNYRKR